MEMDSHLINDVQENLTSLLMLTCTDDLSHMLAVSTEQDVKNSTALSPFKNILSPLPLPLQ